MNVSPVVFACIKLIDLSAGILPIGFPSREVTLAISELLPTWFRMVSMLKKYRHTHIAQTKRLSIEK